MKKNHSLRLSCAALAVLALSAQTQAQTAPAAQPQQLEAVTVTGSLIKRTSKETPSVVQTLTRKDIESSGYTTIEELLRSTSAVDASSIQDGSASGFVSGLATISMRGFGSQGTLLLINGRRVAPVAAIDINFGRGSLIAANNIPKGAIERIDILKDGASAIYGSDAMAGVINYILRKDYEGIEGNAGYTANDRGVGKTVNGGFSFGFGNYDAQGFNVFGGVELSKRDPVFHNELKDRGNIDLHHQYLATQVTGTTSAYPRFTPDSAASPWGSYYRVPASVAGSTTIDGRSVGNNSPFGQHYLGTYAGCPAELTVGQGVATRPEGMGPSSPSFRSGQCRWNFDDADQAISEQERLNASIGATFKLGSDFTLSLDAMFSRTETTETTIPQALTTSVLAANNPWASTWSTLSGELRRQSTIILPVGHPDNPTNERVQVIYRFVDLAPRDVSKLESKRFTLGLQGVLGAWDIDSALLYSRQDNQRVMHNRLHSTRLDAAIANGSYRFNGTTNTQAAIEAVSGDATLNGESSIASIDVRGSRELFDLPGGPVAVALGAEFRKEKLEAVPDEAYLNGDYVGLVGNGTSGSRDLWAGFAEFRLPVTKKLEAQIAARHEKYSDFGNATTGKLGLKWEVLPDTVLRGTVASSFRAPSISQISNAYSLSFHTFSTYAVADPIRCPNGVSLGDPTNNRDCNVLGSSTRTPNPGSIPTIISANPNLKPEKGRSATLGLIYAPTRNFDLALDGWYFERNHEIRASRGVDVMENYIADPANYGQYVIRDPNPATWILDGNGNPVANSGPILALSRVYNNYEYTKISGVDYDLNFRIPATELGRISLKLSGTYTSRYDQLVLAGTSVSKLVGTSSGDIPKTKASATLRLERDNWSVWGRYNHQDKLHLGTTTTNCLNSSTAANVFLRSNEACFIGAESTIDFGVAFEPIEGLKINATLLNALNDYSRSSLIPYAFTYWDTGTSGQLGRRFSLSASYRFK